MTQRQLYLPVSVSAFCACPLRGPLTWAVGLYGPGARGIPSQGEERLDSAELARRVGMRQANVARPGGIWHRVSLLTLEKIARAFGTEIEIKLSA